MPVGSRIRGPGAPATEHEHDRRGDQNDGRDGEENDLHDPRGYGQPAASADPRARRAGLSVRDHGPGIDDALLPRVFDRFVRGEGARTSEGGGGLGLAICREIVSAHGGRIWVDSRTGEGSEFSFALPALLARGSADAAG